MPCLFVVPVPRSRPPGPHWFGRSVFPILMVLGPLSSASLVPGPWAAVGPSPPIGPGPWPPIGSLVLVSRPHWFPVLGQPLVLAPPIGPGSRLHLFLGPWPSASFFPGPRATVGPSPATGPGPRPHLVDSLVFYFTHRVSATWSALCPRSSNPCSCVSRLTE